MTDSRRQALLWGVALAVVVTGVVLSLQTRDRLRAAREAAARRAEELTAVGELAAEVARYEAAYDAVRGAAVAPLPDLDARVAIALPGLKAEWRDLSEDLMSGWRRQRRELSLENVAVRDLLKVVVAAETADPGPAWRLSRCVLRATPNEPGHARAVVVFDALVPVTVAPGLDVE